MRVSIVALRKESVDRNPGAGCCRRRRCVALRKESVDRNGTKAGPDLADAMSLSARRAWIEISSSPATAKMPLSLSARRAWIEIKTGKTHRIYLPSLSARRAWIEILDTLVTTHADFVALRKESVDRNYNPDIVNSLCLCRSPQGERG